MKEEKILIVLPTWLGDFLMCLPSIKGLIERGKAILLGSDSFYPLIREELPSEFYIGLKKRKKGSFLETVRKLWGIKAKRALLLPNSFKSALCVLLGGVPLSIGFPTDARRFILHKRVPFPDKEMHQMDLYLYLVKKAGLYYEPSSLDLSLSKEDLEWAYTVLKEKGWEKGSFAVVHPFSSKEPRSWIPSRFKDVIEAIVRDFKMKVMIVGSYSEHEKVKNLLKGMRERNLKDVWDITLLDLHLGRLAALLSYCSMFVGNDSGPSHLAAALGIPGVVLYGSTSPKRTGAKGMLHIYKEFTCSPCRERFFKDCVPEVEGRPPCIAAISVDDVLEAIQKLKN